MKFYAHRCRFNGVLVSSAVGTSCSPGRTQRIGPSFDKRGSICTIDFSPHGIVYVKVKIIIRSVKFFIYQKILVKRNHQKS